MQHFCVRTAPVEALRSVSWYVARWDFCGGCKNFSFQQLPVTHFSTELWILFGLHILDQMPLYCGSTLKVDKLALYFCKFRLVCGSELGKWRCEAVKRTQLVFEIFLSFQNLCWLRKIQVQGGLIWDWSKSTVTTHCRVVFRCSNSSRTHDVLIACNRKLALGSRDQKISTDTCGFSDATPRWHFPESTCLSLVAVVLYSKFLNYAQCGGRKKIVATIDSLMIGQSNKNADFQWRKQMLQIDSSTWKVVFISMTGWCGTEVSTWRMQAQGARDLESSPWIGRGKTAGEDWSSSLRSSGLSLSVKICCWLSPIAHIFHWPISNCIAINFIRNDSFSSRNKKLVEMPTVSDFLFGSVFARWWVLSQFLSVITWHHSKISCKSESHPSLDVMSPRFFPNLRRTGGTHELVCTILSHAQIYAFKNLWKAPWREFVEFEVLEVEFESVEFELEFLGIADQEAQFAKGKTLNVFAMWFSTIARTLCVFRTCDFTLLSFVPATARSGKRGWGGSRLHWYKGNVHNTHTHAHTFHWCVSRVIISPNPTFHSWMKEDHHMSVKSDL